MNKNQEVRNICYDQDLKMEAYQLLGVLQKFPNHFHEYYVIGCIESGKRHLWCKENEYDLSDSDVIFFSPGENHYCEPIKDIPLDYRAVNVPADTMQTAYEKVTGSKKKPVFKENVSVQSSYKNLILELFEAIRQNESELEKERLWTHLIEKLVSTGMLIEPQNEIDENQQIEKLCIYMEQHYQEDISLDDFSQMSHMGKTYLTQKFTQMKGVTPYRYLQSIRIEQAKKLLESGMDILEVAQTTGFSDQSHFTNFFKTLIGVTPKQYRDIFIEKE